MSETASKSTSTTPVIAYDYVWFGGQRLAQIENATGNISWYFNDHLGTPIRQTDASGHLIWHGEYEPYGTIYAIRRGEGRHQPLRLPGQEYDEASPSESYNIFRWYRSAWGRYSQADPISEPLRHQAVWSADQSSSSLSAARSSAYREPGLPSAGSLRPQDLASGTEPYVYAGDSPVLFKDPLGLAICAVFPIGAFSDYTPSGPPGKTYKGCIYVGVCGSLKKQFLAAYTKPVSLGCPCPTFCLLPVDDLTGRQNGKATCFDFPFVPPLVGPYS